MIVVALDFVVGSQDLGEFLAFFPRDAIDDTGFSLEASSKHHD